MKIEAVDFFYLAMPEVTDEADGSQDALLVRVAAGGHVGWGECEASPLPSIAGLRLPDVARRLPAGRHSVLGKRSSEPADIARIAAEVAYNTHGSPAGAAHLLRHRGGAVGPARARRGASRSGGFSAIGRAYPKIALCLAALRRHTAGDAGSARSAMRGGGFRRREIRLGAVRARRACSRCRPDRGGARRAGAGWRRCWSMPDRSSARTWRPPRARLPALEEAARALARGALRGQRAGSAMPRSPPRRRSVGLAGGEGAHNVLMAQQSHRLRPCRLRPDRLRSHRRHRPGASGGGDYAVREGRHLCQPHLHVAPRAQPSLQPYAGLGSHRLAEYPVSLKPLAHELTLQHLERDGDGEIRAPDGVGLGIDIDLKALARYLVDTEIRVAGGRIYRTPALD